jgi:hypothetical protein
MPHWTLLLPLPAVSTSTSPSRSRGSSSSIVVECAIPRRQVAVVVAPSLADAPRPSPSICLRAVHRRCALGPSPLHSRRPLPSRSRRPCRLTTPATRHAPPRPLVRMVVALSLLTLPPSICQRLSLQHCLSCLLSVRLVVTSPRFSRRHLPLGLSSSWLRRHLSSRRHHISAV